MTHIFDLDESRRQLSRQVADLKNECQANERLQDKFESVSRMLQEQQDKGGKDSNKDKQKTRNLKRRGNRQDDEL